VGTFIWLVIATGLGYFVGDFWWGIGLVGSCIGFLIGLVFRAGAGYRNTISNIGEAFGDFDDYDGRDD
jgi:hypothetical protein